MLQDATWRVWCACVVSWMRRSACSQGQSWELQSYQYEWILRDVSYQLSIKTLEREASFQWYRATILFWPKEENFTIQVVQIFRLCPHPSGMKWVDQHQQGVRSSHQYPCIWRPGWRYQPRVKTVHCVRIGQLVTAAATPAMPLTRHYLARKMCHFYISISVCVFGPVYKNTNSKQ